ncbi:MAG: class II fructose-bisphosphate aldolase [Clostridia bacterium]|nr:class II fructose-bisphosphate aldolase [Clostridia bacterium]
MLASLKEVIQISKSNGRAVGAFNTPNLECLNAVIGAAEELSVPVIISHAQLHEDVSPLDNIGEIMVMKAAKAKVPVCVHLDHGEDIEYCKRAIEIGFTSVMIDKSACSFEENAAATREMTDCAHAKGVDVEAELGRLPNREGGSSGNAADLYTDPNLVNEFIDRSRCDALAIAFGTAHGIYKVKPVLNLDIIDAVRAKTDIPLVMHGGSGISHDVYRDVIRRGINKINYYTYMSYAGYAAAKAHAEANGAGFFHDMALAAQNAMKENALITLKVFSGME